MSNELVLGIYVFIMAIFVGYEVISRVPSVLHTPLMSGTNAIHGIVVLGAFLVAGAADTTLLRVLGFIAVVFGAANVFGGFVVTDRMLEMCSGAMIVTSYLTTVSPGTLSSQLPPCSPARSTITDPGRIALTVSALTSTGAGLPGTSAVVMMTSACSARL